MRRNGFTLIELLVVIAIIAILSAVIFPVFFRARENAYRSSDMSNMNALRSALQIYREDQGAYPPALLGYVTLYGGAPGGYVNTTDGAAPLGDMSNVIPANEIRGFLYPRRVDNIDTFKPAYNRNTDKRAWTTAIWPNQQSGVPDITSATDPDCAKQLYGPTDSVNFGGTPEPATYYKISGYDVSEVRIPGSTRWELRYTPFWTGWGLGQGGCSLGSGSDNPRQLGYSNPPDTTVITWNSYFRVYDSGTLPERGRHDMILFLSGAARPYDSKTLSDRSWAAEP